MNTPTRIQPAANPKKGGPMQEILPPRHHQSAMPPPSPERQVITGYLRGRRVTITFAHKTGDDLLFRVKSQLANSYLNKKGVKSVD